MLVLTDEDTLITREQLDRGFKERMKEQERQAIRALVTAKELSILAKEAEYASSIAEVLNGFVSRIQSTAAEFVAVDSQLAANIDTNTSALPQTSAVPKDNTTFVPNSSYFSEEE